MSCERSSSVRRGSKARPTWTSTPITEEVRNAMAETLRTIAIRAPETVHAQLRLLAQLGGRSLADEVHLAISEHIVRAGEEVDIEKAAQAALDQIDREAESRRQAIQGLLKKPAPGTATAPKGGTKKGS